MHPLTVSVESVGKMCINSKNQYANALVLYYFFVSFGPSAESSNAYPSCSIASRSLSASA